MLQKESYVLAEVLGREDPKVRRLVSAAHDPKMQDAVRLLLRGLARERGIDPDDPPPFGPGPPREEAEAGMAELGWVVTGRGPEYRFRFREGHFLTHMQIDGSTGGGKTLILVHLSLQVHRAGTPVWWLDSEGDLAAFVAAAAPEVMVLNYKDLRLALFEGPEATGLEWLEYLSKLINTFRFAIWFGDGMSNMTRDVAVALRERYGFFTVFEFVDELLRRKYKVKARAAQYWEGLKNRFEGLIVPALGQVYGSGSHDIRALMGRSIVWQLQGLSQDGLALWVTVLLLWMYLAAPITSEPRLNNLLVFDEFGRICRQRGRDQPGTGDNFILDFVQTCRKRQIGILLATQTPHMLPRVILSNTNSWVVLRPTDGHFLRCVSQALELNLNQQQCLMELPDRSPRRAIVRCPGCPQPFMVELPEL